MSLNKKIRRQIKKMPKYKINQEVFDTQNLARSRAFGRDRSIQMADEALDEQAAGDLTTASELSSSTSSLLATIAAINANKTGGKRALAQDEATIQANNVKDLYGANAMVGEEKDKAWRQNVFAPWEAKLGALQQQKANRNQFWSSVTGGLLTAIGAQGDKIFGMGSKAAGAAAAA
jgi:hypothetical protein